MQGMAHRDIFSPNHKITTNFYYVFVTQMISYSLGNGISFDNPEIKKNLGNRFDYTLQKILEYSANDGISFAIVTDTDVIPLNFANDPNEPVFIPLYSESDGRIKAGIRYWRISEDKPLRVTLFEPNGYTEYRKPSYSGFEVIQEKRAYKRQIRSFPDLPAVSDITDDIPENNGLPIVPLVFINRQSHIRNNVTKLSAYNALLSKLANNSDDSDLIYWVLKNCDGMDEIDDAEFITDLIRTHVVHLKNDVEAEPKQLNAPYECTKETLEILRKQLFYDFMAVEFERTSGGNITTSEIKQGYENLNLKADKVEACVSEFIMGVLKLRGFDENEPFHFTRPKNVNESEAVQTAISAAEFMSDEATTKTICEITGKTDEFENIQKQKKAESLERFSDSYGGNENEKQYQSFRRLYRTFLGFFRKGRHGQAKD